MSPRRYHIGHHANPGSPTFPRVVTPPLRTGFVSRILRLAAAAVTILFSAACAAQPAPPPADTLPGFTSDYATNGPIRIHYVRGGTGPALVLLHGWPETWYAWAREMPALAKEYTVIAIDLRGLGDSSPAPNDANGYTATALASDVRAVTDKLNQHSIFLAGHDWGGNVALTYASRTAPTCASLR